MPPLETSYPRGDAPTFLSAFCGCGGFDSGFVATGFRSLGAYDLDTTAVRVYRRNLGTDVFLADLSSGLPSAALSLRPDVLIAGSPCQGFSTVGRRRLDDPRNDLLIVAGRMALAVRPRVFIAENVAGVRAGEHAKFWTGLRELLRSGGYETSEIVVSGTEVGLAQRRRRALLVAWIRASVRLPILPITPTPSLRDVLARLGGTSNHEIAMLERGSVAARIAAHIGPAQKLSNVRSSARAVHTWQVPEVFGSVTIRERQLLEALLRERRKNRLRTFGDADPVTLAVLRKATGPWADVAIRSLTRKAYVRKLGHRYDLKHTFNGNYRRLSWEEPAPTVDTKFGEPRLFLHPDESRGLTVREAARIQGFPDTFVFEGSRRDQFKMVGNAVPPPLATAVAKLALAVLKGS